MKSDKWSRDWPLVPGMYWAYGWVFKTELRSRKADLFYVKVSRGGDNSLFHVTDGHFIYKTEAGLLKWQSAVLPALPSLEPAPADEQG